MKAFFRSRVGIACVVGIVVVVGMACFLGAKAILNNSTSGEEIVAREETAKKSVDKKKVLEKKESKWVDEKFGQGEENSIHYSQSELEDKGYNKSYRQLMHIYTDYPNVDDKKMVENRNNMFAEPEFNNFDKKDIEENLAKIRKDSKKQFSKIYKKCPPSMDYWYLLEPNYKVDNRLITFSEDESLRVIDTPAFTQCLNETLQMEDGKVKEGQGNGGILDIRDECLVLVDQFDTNKFVYQLTDKDNTGIVNLVKEEDFTNLNEVKGEDTKIFICVDQSHLKELNYMFPKDWWTIGHKNQDVNRRFVFAPENTRFKKATSKDGTDLVFIYTVNYGG